MAPSKRARTSPPPVAVRAAVPADLPALARHGARLAREHHAMDAARFFLPEEPIEEGYAWWLAKELESPRAAVLAAVAGRGRAARVVGYAYGRVEGRDWNTLRDRCGVAVDLWVEPQARGAGIGRRLVDALCAALATRGARQVVLSVAARNPAAARLFERAGFRATMVEMTREVGAVAPTRLPRRRRRGVPSRE